LPDSSKTLPVEGTRLTVGQIASLTGVRASAVSNWRSRHPDFPVPVGESAGGDVFDRQQVLHWLRRHGRTVPEHAFSVDGVIWSLMDLLRGVGTMEEGTLVVMQLLYLRARAVGQQSKAKAGEADHWGRLMAAPPRDTARVWSSIVRDLAAGEPALERVLTPSPAVPADLLPRLIGRFDSLPLDAVDWAAAATRLLYRYQEGAAGRRMGLATPESVTALMVGLLKPLARTVYDPACGLAMVLAEAWAHREGDDVLLVGQEVNEFAWRIGYLHLAIHGARFELATGDTLRDDRFRSLRADRVVLEAPLGQRLNRYELHPDERWVHGSTTSAEWMWAQHLAYHLGEEGVGVLTTVPLALERGGTDAQVREGLVEAGILDAVIELPPGMITGTAVAVALLVFARDRDNRADRILFVDARQLGKPRRGRGHELAEDDVERVVSTVTAWRTGKFEDEPLFAAAATVDEVLRGGADLSPKRYVQYAVSVEAADVDALARRVSRTREAVQRSLTNVRALSETVPGAVDPLVPTAEAIWPLVKLRELLAAPLQTGARHDPDGEGEALPYVHTRLVTGGSGTLEELPSEHTKGKVKGRLAQRGDLLLASRGIDPSGRIGCATVAFDGQVAFSESLMLITPDVTRVLPDYLRLYLTSAHGRAALAAVTTGSVIANLRPGALEEIELPLPVLAAQEQIVASTRVIEQALSRLSEAMESCRMLYDVVRDDVAAGRLVPESGKVVSSGKKAVRGAARNK
jgi:hypothetical protein